MQFFTFCSMLTSSRLLQWITSANRLVKHGREECSLSFGGFGTSSVASGCESGVVVGASTIGWGIIASVSEFSANSPMERGSGDVNLFSIPLFVCTASATKTGLCFSVEDGSFPASESLEIEVSDEIKNTELIDLCCITHQSPFQFPTYYQKACHLHPQYPYCTLVLLLHIYQKKALLAANYLKFKKIAMT